MCGYTVVIPMSVHAFGGLPSLVQAAASVQPGRAFLSLHAIRNAQFDACNSVISEFIGALVFSHGCNAGNGKREALRLTGMGGFGRL